MLLLPGAFVILLGATKTDYSKLIVAGERTVNAMESAQGKLAVAIRPLIEMMNNKVESVSKDYWEKNVTPALIQADNDLAPLPELLRSTLPRNFNSRSNDPKDEPWISLLDVSYSIGHIDIKRQNDIFDSEYLMLFIGASNYVEMYVSLLYNRYEMIEREKKRLLAIINDPEGFRTNRIEEKEKEQKERIEKEKREEQEKKLHSLRSTPIKPVLSLDRYRSPFAFAGISLGLEFHDFIKRLKSKGYKLEKQETMKDLFYGFTPVAFMKGVFDGNPARLKIQASSLSYRVYEVTVTIDKVLDEYEADEIINRLAADFASSHPNYTAETENGSQTISLTTSVDETGRIFKRTGIPAGGIILRDYSVSGDTNSYTGMISLNAIRDMSRGYIIDYRLYDYKIGSIARNETN